MIKLLSPNHIEELRALESAVATAPDFDAACRVLVERVSAILDIPAALLARRGASWPVQAASGAVPGSLANAVASAAFSAHQFVVADVTLSDGEHWTYVALDDSTNRQLLLMLRGDWTPSAAVLREWAMRVSAALDRFPLRPRGVSNRRVVTTYGLARRLSRIVDPSKLHQTIVERFAKAVGAEKGSLAVYHRAQNALTIAATYGYADVLVKQLRLSPGAGFIGSVYRSARPLLVENVRQLTEAPARRLRYRTPSFICMPLLSAGHVLGVVSVADQFGGHAFGRRDLSQLRGLASVAALALERNEAVEAARASARLAAVDAVTGLFNRRQFFVRLDEEFERSRRQQSPLTAMMIDLDNFKQLNDRLGHQAGDAVLRIIGDVLRRSVRRFDVCARYGGDEFAVLMPGSEAESSAQIAERIREGIEGSRPPSGPWSDELRVTASIGIASFVATTGEELMARADQALYTAKRDGRNRVCVSTQPDAGA